MLDAILVLPALGVAGLLVILGMGLRARRRRSTADDGADDAIRRRQAVQRARLDAPDDPIVAALGLERVEHDRLPREPRTRR